MDYYQAIAFLRSFPDSERGTSGAKPARSLKMPLSAMKQFLQIIGNPQNAAKTIHITGSKGKGSTAAFIANILHAAGYRTALFTSPHLHSYRERIAFDLKPISREDFAQGVSYLQPYIKEFDRQGQIISTFGILTALFFNLVKKAAPPVDWQIVEVGLGGKDDLTNVFASKEAAVITPISLEHTAILGNTRAAIAANKAEIITSHCLTILAPQTDAEVINIVEQKCKQEKSELVKVEGRVNLGIELKLLGEHQVKNAATAKALAQALAKKGWLIKHSAIEKGLAATYLPGRFEVMHLPHGDEEKRMDTVVLDGAHNGESAAVLAKTLQMVFPNRSVLFVIGVNQDKNIEDIWQALNSAGNLVIATKSANYRSMAAEEIKSRILAVDAQAQIIPTNTIDEAVAKAKTIMQRDQILCVCGSLYLVAEARDRFLEQQTED